MLKSEKCYWKGAGWGGGESGERWRGNAELNSVYVGLIGKMRVEPI